jgi:signal peptidase II
MSRAEGEAAVSVTRLEGRNAWWFILSFATVIADQATKLLVIENLSLYQRIPLLPVLDLVRLHNTGAAFSFLANASGWQNYFFTGVAFVVSLVIVWWLMTLPRSGRIVLAAGLALVLGGAIGNVIDRSLYGYVVDFILFHYRSWSYPAFNVADSAITVGVGLILFDGIILERKRSREEAE